MSFSAHLSPSINNLIWTKAIHSLFMMSDEILLQVPPSSLLLLAVNAPRVAHAIVQFSPSFFEKWQCQGTHSFLFLLSQLSTFFRLGDAKLQAIVFEKPALHDKLFIQVTLKKMIVRKFQTTYREASWDGGDYSNKYRHQNVHRAELDHLVVKMFLSTVPNATEEFMVEFDVDNFTMTGFTRQVIKSEDMLRQPMVCNMIIPVADLSRCEAPFGPVKRCVRMKEFRLFIDIISTSLDKESVAGPIAIEFGEQSTPVVMLYQGDSWKVVYSQVYVDDQEKGECVLFPEYNESSTQRVRVESMISAPVKRPRLKEKEDSETTEYSSDEGMGPTQLATQVRRPKSIFD